MKFKVLKNLKHNGVKYNPGSEVVLTADDSTSKLVTDGVLEVVEIPKEIPKKPEKPKKRSRKK